MDEVTWLHAETACSLSKDVDLRVSVSVPPSTRFKYAPT